MIKVANIDQMSPTENRVPLLKRSGLPRLTTTTQHLSKSAIPTSSIKIPHKYHYTKPRRLNLSRDLYESLEEDVKDVDNHFTTGRPSDRHAWQRFITDESSPFSRQLAKIAKGSDSDLYISCQERSLAPRPAWPANGNFSGSMPEQLSKEYVGRRVVVGDREQGTLRYFGRTAFASGIWCGVELDRSLGKNDGSVDGVIYFTCSYEHGIFAPSDKVSLLSNLNYPDIRSKRSRYDNPLSENSCRLSTISNSSSSSGGSALSSESQRRLSSGASSSATFTIATREELFSGYTSSPTYHKSSSSSQLDAEGSDVISPGDGTFEDSSLGILSPDQMPDFSGPNSLEKSPSDENIVGIECDSCEEGAVGGYGRKWKSRESISEFTEELIQEDISAIIEELYTHEVDSDSPPKALAYQMNSGPSTVPENTFATSKKIDISVRPKNNVRISHVYRIDEDVEKSDHRSFERPSPNRLLPLPLNLEFSPKKEQKPEKRNQEWTTTGTQLNMTMSAASLDQGYQGDGEFDVPSEAGSIPASSPTENQNIFGRVEETQNTSTYSNLSQTDTRLVEEEMESESIIIPKDRRIRIIDGKFYHGKKEITTLRQFDMKNHDPLSSEMDSSGFYSDLDHRDEDSTRMEISSLKPLEEGKSDIEMDYSATEDTTHLDEEYSDGSFERKELEICSLGDSINKEAPSVKQLERKERGCKLLSDKTGVESQNGFIDDEQLTSVDGTKETMKYNFTEGVSLDNTASAITDECKGDGLIGIELDKKTETPPSSSPLSENHICNTTDGNVEVQEAQKPRTYEKPWLNRSIPRKRIERCKPILPPPLPMPKKNVQSKLRIMLESQEQSNDERRQRQPKKGRWDDVMSKIEEGKKEDNLKPKVKEVKSKIMESLKTHQGPSPQVEKMRQERKERREKRERQVAARIFSDRKRSSASTRTSRAPSLESVNTVSTPRFERENSIISQSSSRDKGADVLPKIRRAKVDSSRGIQAKKILRKLPDPLKNSRPSITSSNRVTNNNTYDFLDELKRKDAELCDKNAEIVRCREEARQQEKGIEALSVIINYLTTEYDSFSSPYLKQKVANLCSRLDQLQLNLDDSSASIEKLQHDSEKATEVHNEKIQSLQEKSAHDLCKLKDQHTSELASLKSEYSNKLYELQEDEREERNCLEERNFLNLEYKRNEYLTSLEESKTQHLLANELLKIGFVKKLTEQESRLVDRENEYKEEKLQVEKEKDSLKKQAKMLEKTLLSDKDHKLQAAKGVCTALENEVDSLKSVLDMRNIEIHQLREQVIDREILSDDLQSARDTIGFLKAKIEDLSAQMERKSELERERYAEYLQMSDSVQRESSINQRLTQDNEELLWKIHNRSSINNDIKDFGSCSTHQSFMDGRYDAGYRYTSTPKRMNGSDSCLRSLDESFKKKAMANFKSSPPNSPLFKHIIQKSNSVSFILDLNEAPLNETETISPLQSKTPLKKGNGVAKSSSTSQVYRDPKNYPIPFLRKINGAIKGKLQLKLKHNENLRSYRSRNSSGASETDEYEVERISPTGAISWTVPSECPQKSRILADPPSLLQHLDEDEYEESDLVEVIEIEANTINEGSLSNMLESRVSSSPSDSDASQCGSRAELSSSTDSSDDGTELAALAGHWVLQDGAGEAMIAADALGSRSNETTDKDSDRPQSNTTSLFSSDSEDVLPKGSMNISWSEDCELTSSSEMQDL